MDAITESLLENSKSAIIGCIELHNKPKFSYRYEVCTILAINAWELLLKAYISENCKKIVLVRKDGTSKPFDECVSCVSSEIGKEFRATEENLRMLYEFRCHVIHFYKDKIDIIIYSLLHKSILFYNNFSRKYFNIDLAEDTNLMLLPIGFKPFASPVDFLAKQSEIEKSSGFIQNFIKNILISTELLENEGISEPILSTFQMAVLNEKRITNADIIVGITQKATDSKLSISNVLMNNSITDDESAKEIRIDEDSIFKTYYTLSYSDVTGTTRNIFSDFKQNAKFNRIMFSIKGNPKFHKIRYLDVVNKTGTGKDYYSSYIYEELSKHYTRRDQSILESKERNSNLKSD